MMGMKDWMEEWEWDEVFLDRGVDCLWSKGQQAGRGLESREGKRGAEQ
jgi:hypothetical protein